MLPNARAIDTIAFAIRGVLIDFDSMLEPRAVAFRPLVTNRERPFLRSLGALPYNMGSEPLERKSTLP